MASPLVAPSSRGLYPGLLGNPPLSQKPSLPKQLAMPARLLVDSLISHRQLTPRPQSAVANGLDLRGRPRVTGRPCGGDSRPIPKPSPHKGRSSASRSSGAGWSRLKRGAFCAPAAPPVTRASLRFRARVPGERSGRWPGHGPVAAGAPQMQGASSGRLGGPRSGNRAETRLLWAPGVRPGRAAATLGCRGRLGVGTGRGRGSSSPFRRPSSRLPRPLFPGRPARPQAGPFTFKQRL